MRSSCYSRDGQLQVEICLEIYVHFFGDMFKDYDNKFVTKDSRNSSEFSFDHFDLKFFFKYFFKKEEKLYAPSISLTSKHFLVTAKQWCIYKIKVIFTCQVKTHCCLC